MKKQAAKTSSYPYGKAPTKELKVIHQAARKPTCTAVVNADNRKGGEMRACKRPARGKGMLCAVHQAHKDRLHAMSAARARVPQPVLHYTTEETLALLLSSAQKDGDSFTLKLSRRANPGQPPGLLASFSLAQMRHFRNPEFWVPQLCGGGSYLLQGFHERAPHKPVGGCVQIQLAGDNRPFDVAEVKKTWWPGPLVLEYPPTPKPAVKAARTTEEILAAWPGVVDQRTPAEKAKPDIQYTSNPYSLLGGVRPAATRPAQPTRQFTLNREADVVAEGIRFSNGEVVVHWLKATTPGMLTLLRWADAPTPTGTHDIASECVHSVVK